MLDTFKLSLQWPSTGLHFYMFVDTNNIYKYIIHYNYTTLHSKYNIIYIYI